MATQEPPGPPGFQHHGIGEGDMLEDATSPSRGGGRFLRTYSFLTAGFTGIT